MLRSDLLYIDSGTDAKTVQEMSRHDTAAITFKVYGRAKKERMGRIADKVGDMLADPNAHTAPTQGNGTA